MGIYQAISSQDLLNETSAAREFTAHLTSQRDPRYSQRVESQAKSEVLRHEQDLRQSFVKSSIDQKNDVNQAALAEAMNDLKRSPESIAVGFQSETREIRAELDEAQRRFRDAKGDLEMFRQNNKLDRLAFYPEHQGRVYIWIIAMLLIESVMNSIFFAKASSAGLVGGFLMAFILSFLNISIGGMASFGARLAHHVTPLKTILGVMIMTLAMTVSGALALFVGHYRTALDQDIERAPFMAVESMIENPLGIGTFDSWILVAISIVIFFLAFWKWFKNDDPYPRYGDMDRRIRDTEEDYRDQCSELNQSLEQLKRDEMMRFEHQISGLTETFTAITLARDNYDKNHREYSSFLSLQAHEFRTFCFLAREMFADQAMKVLETAPLIEGDPDDVEFEPVEKGTLAQLQSDYDMISSVYNNFMVNELPELKGDYEARLTQLIMEDRP